MKRLAVVLVLLLLVVPAVKAQTNTPTISPVIHWQGDYMSGYDTNLTLSGTWSTVTSGYATFYRTTSTTAWLAYTVSDSICTIAVQGSGPFGSGWTIEADDGIGGTHVWLVIGGTPGVHMPYTLDVSDQNANFTLKFYLNTAGTLDVYVYRMIECHDYVGQTPVPTATAVPTATPPNTPVPTATILPSSTPGVPTATILPSSTPGVPTATILPSSTPANTPVDTPTEITFVDTPTEINTPVDTPTEINTPVDTPTEITFVDTPTEINIDPTIEALLTLIAGGPTPDPNTPTPSYTPSVTSTPTPEPRACVTLPVSGQLACFDYIVTADDVHMGNLLTLIFFSVWGFFLFAVLVLWRSKQ